MTEGSLFAKFENFYGSKDSDCGLRDLYIVQGVQQIWKFRRKQLRPFSGLHMPEDNN